jgi:DNA-binding MarR family transcriptional regulator
MITQIVDEVEARGLAERRRNPDDRRSYLVSLTAKGRRKLAAAQRVSRTVAAEIAAAIGEEGDRELRSLLRKMVGS